MATVKTRFIALLTAGALALGAASPAAAASDGQKVVNTILGIAALGGDYPSDRQEQEKVGAET